MFITGTNYTGNKLFTYVNDTGDYALSLMIPAINLLPLTTTPAMVNCQKINLFIQIYSGIFVKIRNGSYRVFMAMAETDLYKKTEAENLMPDSL